LLSQTARRFARPLIAGVRCLQVKRPFIAVHDYQHGGMLVRVFAETLDDVASMLRPPTWRVYAESDPECPDVKGIRVLESDIDCRADWLCRQVYIQDRQAEGKRGYPVRGTRAGHHEYREIWARCEEEILGRFTELELLFGVPLGDEEMRSMGLSDVDAPDDFTKRYQRDA
jgi:hypothetical protein